MDVKLIREALEIGLICAQESANNYHMAMAGYHPDRHEEIDNCVRKIEAAISLLNDDSIVQLASPE